MKCQKNLAPAEPILILNSVLFQIRQGAQRREQVWILAGRVS